MTIIRREKFRRRLMQIHSHFSNLSQVKKLLIKNYREIEFLGESSQWSYRGQSVESEIRVLMALGILEAYKKDGEAKLQLTAKGIHYFEYGRLRGWGER